MFKQVALFSVGLPPSKKGAAKLLEILQKHQREDLFSQISGATNFDALRRILAQALKKINPSEVRKDVFFVHDTILLLDKSNRGLFFAVDVLIWFLHKTLEPNSIQRLLSLTLPDAVEEKAATVMLPPSRGRLPRTLVTLKNTLARREDGYEPLLTKTRLAVDGYIKGDLSRHFSEESRFFEAEIHRLWEGLLGHMDAYSEIRLPRLKFRVGDNPILFVDFLLAFTRACRNAVGTQKRDVGGISPDDIWRKVLSDNRSEADIAQDFAVFIIHEYINAPHLSGQYLRSLVDHALNTVEGLSSEMCAWHQSKVNHQQRKDELGFGRFFVQEKQVRVLSFFQNFEQKFPTLFRRRIEEFEKELQNHQYRVKARYEALCMALRPETTAEVLSGSHPSVLLDKVELVEGRLRDIRQNVSRDRLNSLEALVELFKKLKRCFDDLSELGNKFERFTPVARPVESVQKNMIQLLSPQIGKFGKNFISSPYEDILRDLKKLLRLKIKHDQVVQLDQKITLNTQGDQLDRKILGYLGYIYEGLRCYLAGTVTLDVFFNSLLLVDPNQFSQSTNLASIAQVAHLVGQPENCLDLFFSDLKVKIDKCRLQYNTKVFPTPVSASGIGIPNRAPHATELYFELEALKRLSGVLDNSLETILNASMPNRRPETRATATLPLPMPQDIGCSPQKVSIEEVQKVPQPLNVSQYIFSTYRFLGVAAPTDRRQAPRLPDRRLDAGVFNMMAEGLKDLLEQSDSGSVSSQSTVSSPRESSPVSLGYPLVDPVTPPLLGSSLDVHPQRPPGVAEARRKAFQARYPSSPRRPAAPSNVDGSLPAAAQSSSAAAAQSPYASSLRFLSPTESPSGRVMPRRDDDRPASPASGNGRRSPGVVRRTSGDLLRSFQAGQLADAYERDTRNSQAVSKARLRMSAEAAANDRPDPTLYSLAVLDPTDEQEQLYETRGRSSSDVPIRRSSVSHSFNSPRFIQPGSPAEEFAQQALDSLRRERVQQKANEFIRQSERAVAAKNAALRAQSPPASSADLSLRSSSRTSAPVPRHPICPEWDSSPHLNSPRFKPKSPQLAAAAPGPNQQSFSTDSAVRSPSRASAPVRSSNGIAQATQANTRRLVRTPQPGSQPMVLNGSAQPGGYSDPRTGATRRHRPVGSVPPTSEQSNPRRGVHYDPRRVPLSVQAAASALIPSAPPPAYPSAKAWNSSTALAGEIVEEVDRGVHRFVRPQGKPRQ